MINDELARLQKESEQLHSLAMSEPHLPSRKQLMANRAKVIQQINILTEKKQQAEEVTYRKKLNELITEHKEFILFAVNGNRVTIQEDLTVQITFSPCRHTQTLPIKEVLRRYDGRTPEHERYLFDSWNDMMRNNVTYNGSKNCQQCRKDKEKRLAKLRRYDDKPIPRIAWELRKLQ